jgi:polyisoprenoid-binding protein YceI
MNTDERPAKNRNYATIPIVHKIPKAFYLILNIFGLVFLLLCSYAWAKGGPHPAQDPGGYKIDAGHSGIHFKAHHHDAGYTWGRFQRFGGGFVTGDDGQLLSIEATARARSVDTDNILRDLHVKSFHYLGVLRYPVIRFHSEVIKKIDNSHWEVTGPLELHGITLPLTVVVKKTGEGIGPFGKQRFGLETEFTISLADFGIVREGVGDDLQLFVNLEGTRK